MIQYSTLEEKTIFHGRYIRNICLIVFLWLYCFSIQAATIEVRITGIDDVLTRNVLANLSLYQQREASYLTEGRINWLYAQAEDEIRIALQPLGYYQPKMTSSLSYVENRWLANFQVNAGVPVTVKEREIRVSGDASNDDYFNKAITKMPLAPGAIARHDEYEQIKKSLLRIASQRGYFDAKFVKHEMKIDVLSSTAILNIHLDSGSRYRFGEVTFNQVTLSDEFLNQYVPFVYGDPYDASKILELQKILSDSDYFTNVVVQPQTQQAETGHIPVSVQLSMRSRTKYTLGIGYGTDTGPRGSAGLERRYVNTRGHGFKSSLSASELVNRFSAEYTIPLGRPQSDRLVSRLEWSDETTDTSTSETSVFSISREQPSYDWRRTQSLTYQEDRFQVGNDSGHSRLLMPSIGYSRIFSDHPITPTKGRRLRVELRGAVEGIISDTSFLQLRASGKWIFPIAKGRLLLRADLGTSWIDEFSELPPSVRFFTGGDWSVRGFDYNTLGPKDSSGKVKGGKHLVVGSVEYDHLVAEKWRAAVFYDTGNAIDHFNDSLEQSAGFGIRWKSPVGWVRVDLAHPLASNENWRVHFTIGPDL
jgi:translocation and assembly module TamA